MDHELTFQQIKDSVELPELLAHYGYALKKGENLNKGKWHVFEGDDTLVVFKGRGNDWMYFNSQDDRDKGSVIDWMKNRVSSGRIVGIQQAAGRNLWQSVNDQFRAYLNLPEAQRPRLDLTPLAPTEPGARFQSIYTQNCTPLTDTSYLQGRGITKETLVNPQFAGRILNQYHTVQREGMPAKTYTNTAFPAYHEGRVVGLELKGEGYKGQAPDGEFARSLWLSKQPEGGRRATTLVVSESGVDTLSYAQLHPQERAIYASTAGILTQNKIFEMKRIMASEGLLNVKSAFDNDTQGHHFDTRLLAGFAGEQNPMRVVREHKHLLTVEITPGSPAGVQAMAQQLKAFNAQTTTQYQQTSGEQPSQALLPTLRDELIATTKVQANTYQFHLPMNRDALAAFNQAAVKHLQFEQKIELVKSRGKDWNQDLKEAQLQAVVKRELGGPDERPQPATTPAPPQVQLPPAQPQVKPSESSAHDQARRTFIEAASVLSQELRAQPGQATNAGYLQDISRHLAKQPQLRETDHQNLAKVLASVDKLDALKDTPAAQQLRQVLPTLEKPVQAQTPQQTDTPPRPERRRGPSL